MIKGSNIISRLSHWISESLHFFFFFSYQRHQVSPSWMSYRKLSRHTHNNPLMRLRLLVTRPECKGRTKDGVSTATQLFAISMFPEQINEGVVSFSHKSNQIQQVSRSRISNFPAIYIIIHSCECVCSWIDQNAKEERRMTCQQPHSCHLRVSGTV